MGYYVALTDYDVAWKDEAAKEAALAHVKATMFTDEALETQASGGQFGGNSATLPVAMRAWYSWVSTDVCRKATDIGEIIEEFFDAYYLYDELQWHVEFDSKAGQEDLLMKTLAPFIEAGSYMAWRGEEGELYRWMFDGETMTTQEAEIVWR